MCFFPEFRGGFRPWPGRWQTSASPGRRRHLHTPEKKLGELGDVNHQMISDVNHQKLGNMDDSWMKMMGFQWISMIFHGEKNRKSL